MRKRTRYLLLLLGFIAFLILSPLTVMYVRGVTFDFETRTFVATGILAIRSDPKAVDVFLNSEVVRHGSGDIRFLAPGEYQVDLKKEGYHSWGKRFVVEPGKVTWANPASETINLFFTEAKIQSLQSGVLDFYNRGSQLVYLTANKISVASPDNLKSQRDYPLPKIVNKIIATDDSGRNFVLTQSHSLQPETVTSAIPLTILVFNATSGRVYDISSLFTTLPKMQFDSNGDLYALSAGTLYKIDLANTRKTTLLNQIKAFYLLDSSLYFLRDEGSTYSLFVGQSPFRDNQVLLESLLQLQEPELFVTFEKQIFILSNGSLYLAGSSMQRVVDNISVWNFDQQNSSLAIVHSGQLDYYDSLSQNLNFVTRSNEAILQAAIKTTIGGSFLIKNNKLMEIELDTRDNQNQYVLYQGERLQKFTVDDTGTSVLLLDNGELKNLTVR